MSEEDDLKLKQAETSALSEINFPIQKPSTVLSDQAYNGTDQCLLTCLGPLPTFSLRVDLREAQVEEDNSQHQTSASPVVSQDTTDVHV